MAELAVIVWLIFCGALTWRVVTYGRRLRALEYKTGIRK